MATTKMMRAAIRTENGRQVIVLPGQDLVAVQLDVVRQDAVTGEVTVSSSSPQGYWRAVFAAIDSHGPVPDEEWDQLKDRIVGARVSRQDSDPLEDSDRSAVHARFQHLH